MSSLPFEYVSKISQVFPLPANRLRIIKPLASYICFFRCQPTVWEINPSFINLVFKLLDQLKTVVGLEPTIKRLQLFALPLGYTVLLGWHIGIEPMYASVTNWCVNPFTNATITYLAGLEPATF